MSIVSTTVEYNTHTCVELIKTNEAKYVSDLFICALQHQNKDVEKSCNKSKVSLLQGITVIIA